MPRAASKQAKPAPAKKAPAKRAAAKKAPAKRSATGKATPKVIDTLNELRARELAVIIQYMRHHYTVTGADGLALADEFKDVAITEMNHAEILAERIDFLGGDPTTTPGSINRGAKSLAQMATVDLAAENEAVDMYRRAIAVMDAAGDITSRRILEDILADEEEHVATFQMMLGK